MSRHRWESNLDGFCRTLEDYAEKNAIRVPNPLSAAATRLSSSLYLAHSTSDAKFSDICADGYLASATHLAAQRNETLASGRTEVALGTADSVFFFVSPFRMPHTGCGLLFAGITGYCGLALLLAKMPWNRSKTCGSYCEVYKS